MTKHSYVPAEELERKNGGLVDIKNFEEVDERVFTSTKGSEVAKFYEGTSIFITGGTGFMGQLLIENLLRKCEGIENIFILIREKRGKSIETRMEKMCSGGIFDQLRKKLPDFKSKIVPIEGDVSLPFLGIKETDIQLLVSKVNIIFHAAATVKFDEELPVAVNINVNGTKRILEIAKQCQNFKSFIYISTAFSNCTKKEIDEKFYDLPTGALEVIRLSEKGELKVDDTKRILGNWPNTYTFTKAIAEHTLLQHGNGLPICMMRPAIVVSTLKEPLKGWTNNLYGPIGAVLGVGVGLIRTFMADCEKNCDLVPADYVTNATICCPYDSSLTSNDDIKIYNFVSSTENPINWGDFHDLVRHYGLQVPTMKSIWHCSAKLTYNYYRHLFMTILTHLLPGIIVDAGLLLTGRRPKMTSVYLKIQKLNNVLLFFSGSEWNFKNNNLQLMWKNLSEQDKKAFSFSMDPSNFNWNEELHHMCLGMRKFLLKEDFSTMPEAYKKAKRLFYYDLILKIVVLFLLFKFLLLPLINLFL